MSKRLLISFTAILIVLPMVFFGCKGKVEKSPEEANMEMSTTTPIEGTAIMPVTEPAQTVATETIPPTAAPEIKERPAVMPIVASGRNKDIQRALKSAGFYTGSIDGKVGPRTKAAIEAFQKAKGLKVDGKVGQRTWAELEKYLAQ